MNYVCRPFLNRLDTPAWTQNVAQMNWNVDHWDHFTFYIKALVRPKQMEDD